LGRPDRCTSDDPALHIAGGLSDHVAACHFTSEVSAALLRVTASGEASGERVDRLAIEEEAAAAAAGTPVAAALLPMDGDAPSEVLPGQLFAGPGLDVPALDPPVVPAGQASGRPVTDALPEPQPDRDPADR